MNFKIQKIAAYLLLTFSTLALFTACQKENIEEALTPDAIQKAVADLPNESVDAITIYDSIQVQDGAVAQSRSRIHVYGNNLYLSRGQWQDLRVRQFNFDDGYTYYAYVVPTSGDPDVIAYGQRGSSLRWLRSGETPGGDDTYIMPSDIRSNDDYGTFRIYGYTNTNLRVDIYKERSGNGDGCVIDGIALGIYCPTVYEPVCGCNGVTYPNECEAEKVQVPSWTSGPCSGGNSCGNTCEALGDGNITICDNMEDYSNGSISNQSSHWRKWNNSSNDADITTYRRFSGSKSMRVRRHSSGSKEDVVLQVGNHQSQTHRIAWKMYVPRGKSGYFNTQKYTTPGIEWGSEVYFYTNRRGKIKAGGSSIYFNYPQERWFDVELIISLSGDYQSLTIDGQFIRSWPYHYTSSGTNGSRRLGGINFYAVGNNSDFFIDNVCFEEDYTQYTTHGGGRIKTNSDAFIDTEKPALKKESISPSNM